MNCVRDHGVLTGMTRLLAMMAAIALLTAVPAQAHDKQHFLALGDSIATGRQAVPVTPNQGYVAQLARKLPQLELTNLACDGETTTTMRTGGMCSYPDGDQLDAALKFIGHNKVKLITITVAGNDIAPCGTQGIDPACIQRATATIDANLRHITAKLRKAAPKATIVGMTLYDPFLAAWLTGPDGQEFARQSVVVTQSINDVIESAYRASKVKVADVEGAFATTDLTTIVNGLPLAVARICQWTTTCTAADIHPTTEGYTAIQKAYLPLVR